VFWILTGYFAFLMIAGRPDNWYWGFMIAPLLPVGVLGYFFGSRRPVITDGPISDVRNR